jgi:sarcosine oxidase subunit alpha
MYVNSFAKLQPGRCRYGLMLGENGFVMDDGVVARLAPNRFHVTTTTGGAARVLATMEDYLQTEWPDLRVSLASVTEQWAVLAVQGPRARSVLEPLVEGIDIGRDAMPHMSVRTGRILGVPTRLFRVSFTGELGFEVNVPAGDAPAVWDAVSARVQEEGGCLYGTEAMHVMRAEKGYVIVGQETDGTVTADDLGLGGMVSARKRDFVGKRSLARADLARPGRKQLVGLLTPGPSLEKHVLDEGAQVVAAPGSRQPLGHVTSAYASATVGHPIALALVENGRARIGQTLSVPMPAGPVPVRVTNPVFLDPEGERLHA